MRSQNIRMAALTLCAASVWIACGGAVADPKPVSAPAPEGGRDAAATRLNLVPRYFEELEIASTRSMPPQFLVTATREMPTPGYAFAVETVKLDAGAGSIVVEIVETKPSGMVAQVITPATLKLNLGEVPKGRHRLELWIRRGSAPPQLAQTEILAAN